MKASQVGSLIDLSREGDRDDFRASEPDPIFLQRGNKRLPCFLDDDDRLRYLQLLARALLATRRLSHAYVLMEKNGPPICW